MTQTVLTPQPEKYTSQKSGAYNRSPDLIAKTFPQKVAKNCPKLLTLESA